MSTQSIYFDYAAATPMEPQVLLAMQPYLTDRFYNPSANYLHAKAVAADLLAARQSAAHWLGAKLPEIIFTAGGTEANNLAITGVLSQFPEGNVVVSAIEHDSVRQPASQYTNKEVPVGKDGVIDVAALADLIDDNTVLVSIMYANNEVGTVQPLREIATLLQKIKKQRQQADNDTPLYLHTDACQAANYLDLHVAPLGVDLMTVNGGKIYGPKQSGILFIKTGVQLSPQILGGGQERGIRSGTENIAGAVGFAKALDMAQEMRGLESKRLVELRDSLIKQLQTIPRVFINGSLKKHLPNNVSVTFPGTDNERLMMQLDEVGIMVAVGSACSASKDEPSHVLQAIGLSEAEAQATLRLTLGRQTTQAAVDTLIQMVKGLL
jgi:cysteine desulfurase